MASPITREVWLDAKGNVVAPNTPGATRHRVRFDPDGNVYRADWTPAKPKGGLWEGGPFSTPAGQGEGTWSEYYWVDSDKPAEPKAPTTREDPSGNVRQWNPDQGSWQPAPGMPTTESEPQAPTVRSDPYGNSQQWNPAKGAWEPAPGMPTKANTVTVGNSILQLNPSTGRWDVVYAAPREPTGQLTDYQRWQIGNYPQEEGEKRRQFDLQEMRARLDREAQDRRNQLTNQATLFGQMSGARERNLEWQLPQDAKYLPLMEPGGVMSRLLPGVKPMEVVRVPWDQISGEEIWKRTRGMTGGG